MPKSREPLRLDVRKTYKLFIDGSFVRSESGRSDAVDSGAGETANVSRASRKDLRDAVDAARTAFGPWSGATPAQRGLVLYRLAEMMDARRGEFVERLRHGAGLEEADALRETTAAIDRTLWYAGWCDKYASVISSRNPVAGPYVNVSTPEPVGVVGTVAADAPSLLGLVSALVPALVAGNTVVALASEADPRTAIVFAECLATCDLPPGAANVLTGRRIEVAPHLARHMDVDALETFDLDASFAAELQRLAADNLKRVRVVPRPLDRRLVRSRRAGSHVRHAVHGNKDDLAPGGNLTVMANEPAPYPIDDLHAAAPEAATHIDALHAELSRERPDAAAIDAHVETLRGHNGVVSLLEKWYLDEKTQAFVAELNGIGL